MDSQIYRMNYSQKYSKTKGLDFTIDGIISDSFKKWVNPGLYFVYFRSFRTSIERKTLRIFVNCPKAITRLWAIVVSWWSARSLSISMIRVRILPKHTVFSCKKLEVLEKNENKQKEAGIGRLKTITVLCQHLLYT